MMKSDRWIYGIIIVLIAFAIRLCFDFYNLGHTKGYKAGTVDTKEYYHSDGTAEVVSLAEDDAVDYVREHSDLHPDEARCIIACYNAGKTRCDYGFEITDSIYREAVCSLYYFADYYYSGHYK